jgi:hypothetical protein
VRRSKSPGQRREDPVPCREKPVRYNVYRVTCRKELVRGSKKPAHRFPGAYEEDDGAARSTYSRLSA